LVAMPILIDRAPDEADLMALARRHRLTVYGAAYLELARRRREPLATLDKKLAAAAKAESVALFAAP
jgi:predicted nucleic acid-binding protein